MPSSSKPASGGKNNVVVLAVLAVILLVIAGAYALNFSKGRAEEAAKTAAQDPQKQIEAIQNNPNMPAQAKAMAINAIKAHQGETRSSQPAQNP